MNNVSLFSIMNACCTAPVEKIARNEHLPGGQCCLITERSEAPSTANCPVSHTVSRKVQRRTLEHLLKPEKVGLIQDVQYYYCTEPTCEVVYFSNEKVKYFTTDDIAVKVFSKDQGADVNVCYCFDWTRGRIRQQIEETGKSTAAMEIAREIKAGRCECDIKNPKGECCLGEVNQVVKESVTGRKI